MNRLFILHQAFYFQKIRRPRLDYFELLLKHVFTVDQKWVVGNYGRYSDDGDCGYKRQHKLIAQKCLDINFFNYTNIHLTSTSHKSVILADHST